jgi:hypothetical protein
MRNRVLGLNREISAQFSGGDLMGENLGKNRRDSERMPIEADIEFVVDSGTIFGETLDVSQSGISLETSKPLTIQLRVKVEGDQEARRAELVWSKELSQGRMRYGLRFVD